VLDPVPALSVPSTYAFVNAYKVGWREVGGSVRIDRLDKVSHRLPTVLHRARVLRSRHLSAEIEAAPYVVEPAARHAGLPAKGRRVEEAAGRFCFPQVSAATKLEPGTQNEGADEFEELAHTHRHTHKDTEQQRAHV
jgi:hypothetical protein